MRFCSKQKYPLTYLFYPNAYMHGNTLLRNSQQKMKQSISIEIICFLLIILFAYAAAAKLFHYNTFREQWQDLPLLSPLAKAAWILPCAELITCAMLCVKTYRSAGLYFSFILMLVFTVYIAGVLVSAKHLPCSCGGVLKQMTWKRHLVFNLFFTGIAFTGIIIQKKVKNIAGVRNPA